MGRVTKIGLAIAVAAIVGAALYSHHATSNQRLANTEVAHQDSPRTVQIARFRAGQPDTSPGQELWRGSPSGITEPVARYRYLRDCSTFRRFSVMFETQRSNPDYPLNNPQKLMALSPIERKMLDDRVKLVQTRSEECAPWLAVVTLEVANWQVIDATLDAALAGDDEASACFVMALWAPEPENSKSYATLKSAYSTYAGRFIDEQVKQGNWSGVLAAYSAASAAGGLTREMGANNQQRYTWARLLQLGSPRPDLVESFGFSAAQHAAQLTAAEISKLDRAAERTFKSSFNGRKITDAELYENCGN